MSTMVDVKIEVTGSLNAAKAQCGAAPVKQATLKNLTDNAIVGCELHLYAENGELVEQRVSVGCLPPKGEYRASCAGLRANMPNIQVSEGYETVVRAELRRAGEVVGRSSAPLEVTPFDHWDAFSPSSLAAFCVPNHPMLDAVRRRASQIVEAKTGSSSIDGYNGGESRVCALAAAVFEACRELDIAYAKPPASFGVGQRIRLANQVIAGHAGTCIDVAFLYASCLESMRINALVAVTQNHAFAGFYLANECGKDAVVKGAGACRSLFAEGKAVFAECTLFTNGHAGATFERAAEAARSTFNTDAELEYVVDIAAARRAGIRPLPQVTAVAGARTAGGATGATGAPDGASAVPALASGPDGGAAFAPGPVPSAPSAKPQLEPAEDLKPTMLPVAPRDVAHEWLGRLLDLSLRNPALNMKLGSRVLELDVPSAVEAVRMLNAGEACEVKGADERALASLDRAARRTLAETGAAVLCVGLGAVRWRRADEKDLEETHVAPLVLVPAELVRDRMTRRFSLRADFQGASVNMSLVELVRSEFGAVLPHYAGDFSACDAQETFVRAVASACGVLTAAQGWAVLEDVAVVGLFPQANTVLYRDLKERVGCGLRNGIVRGLMSGGAEGPCALAKVPTATRAAASRGIDASTSVLLLAADGSQLKAIEMAAAGNSFVVDGPPGTGKSQVIVNIAVDAAAHGKSVLVVSEKAAALDVVRDRMIELGLGGMCLELYGKVAKADALARLSAALRMAEEGAEAADTHKMLADWAQGVRDVAAASLPLDEFGAALDEPLLVGLSRRDAIARLVEVRNAEDVVLAGSRALSKLRSINDVREAHRFVERMAAVAEALSEGAYACVAEHPLALISPEQCEAEGLAEALDDVPLWQTWLAHAAEARRRGLESVADALARGVSLERVRASLDKALCGALLACAASVDDRLDACAGAVLDRTVAQYSRADEGFRLRLRGMAAQSHLGSVRRICRDDRHANEVVGLRRVLQSRGRGVSLRQVLSRFRNVVLGLCPCVLATPALLAQHFEQDVPFDLVIFDEASQVETAHAVGVLERAHQVVVAGDPQQMPPSVFFARQGGLAADEASDIEVLLAAGAGANSLLDDCLALGLPRVMLRWHYRSRHESLISFSNEHFYEGRLRTFPSPDDRESKVSLRKVEGTYEGAGVNRVEAEAVVAEVRRRFDAAVDEARGAATLAATPSATPSATPAFPSLGIITFNVRQQALIEKLLDDEFARDAAFAQWAQDGPDPLEVRNLENTQGDEHDVVLLSVAYGPDVNGKVAQRFGPLNVAGGERRLNVAITRARCEMAVFSSMTADCIEVSRDASGGVVALKEFLAYAQSRGGKAAEGVAGGASSGAANGAAGNVASGVPSGTAGGARDDVLPVAPAGHDAVSCGAVAATGMRLAPAADPIAQSLAEALRAQGWQAECGVGASELKVDVAVLDPAHPGRYLLGIMLDGPSFRAARTTRDRFLGRDEMLEGLGWNLAHVWSVDCQSGFDREVRRLVRRLKKLAA